MAITCLYGDFVSNAKQQFDKFTILDNGKEENVEVGMVVAMPLVK